MAVTLALASCDSDQGAAQQAQAPPPAAAQQPAAPPAAAAPAPDAAPPPDAVPPPVPAVSVTQASWAPDALEELLAPIALYPDALLSQILAASVNSQEVLDAGNWLLENQDLTGDALDAAAQKVGFGPPMRALLYFPTVLDMMCQEMDWTRQLGSAFSSDQKAVLDAVQRLRAQAAEVGNLKDTKQQTVETKTENDKTIIEVKPADPMVVYVPQYNPQVVYVQPPPPPPPPTTTTTTTVIHDDDDDEVAAGLIGFGVGLLVAGAFHNDYYCSWGYGAVYMGPRPFYPPAYAYRPVYGPAFRPAYGYAPPAGYRNNYRSGYRSGNNVNININNNYFNNFSNNKNLKAGNNANSALGRSSYAGARDNATSERLGQAAGGANRAGAADNRAQQGNLGGNRPQAGNLPADRAQTGNLGANRAEAGNLQGRPSTANRAQPVDRGYGTSTRQTPAARPTPASSVARPSPTPAVPPPRPSSNGFSGASAGGNGSFDRAASARGHASAGSRPAARSSGGGGGRRR